MARIRSVKPEFWADEQLAAAVCRDARLLYIGLWNLADEHGRLRGAARFIKGQIFPYDDDLTTDHVEKLLDELDAAHKVVRYEYDGDRYAFLPNLFRHQRLESAKVPSKIPPPPDEDDEEDLAPAKTGPRAPSENDLDPEKKVTPPENNPNSDQPCETPCADEDVQVSTDAQIGADESAPGADQLSLLYVVGSMEHGAGITTSAISVSDDGNVEGVAAAELRDEKPVRHDVERLCRTLADSIGARTNRRPSITQRWRDSARLMLDKDKIPLDQALGAIEWSNDHNFWRSVVLSMPKLREHYGAMLLQAETKHRSGASSGTATSHNAGVLERRRARRGAQA